MTTQTWQEQNREMQDNGVAFEIKNSHLGMWVQTYLSFAGHKEWYRIAEKQSIEGRKYLANMKNTEEPKKPLISHIAERRLWLDQMEAGEPVEWQEFSDEVLYHTYRTGDQPGWIDGFTYKPKLETKKMYFALLRGYSGGYFSVSDYKIDNLLAYVKADNCTIIGDIEEREVEV